MGDQKRHQLEVMLNMTEGMNFKNVIPLQIFHIHKCVCNGSDQESFYM
jgi:hypothetical protein